MKHLPSIAAALLGLIFIVFGLNFFLKFIPMPPGPPEGTPPAHFMAALFPTGYLAFIKVLEIIGGLFTAIPRTRVLGLLILGPIILNILAYHVFLTGGAGLADPIMAIITLVPLYLIYVHRQNFTALLQPTANRPL